MLPAVTRLGLLRRAAQSDSRLKRSGRKLENSRTRLAAAGHLRQLKAEAKKETGHTGRKLLGGEASKRSGLSINIRNR